MTGVHPVNRGTIGDARSIAALLAEAFELDPVSRWLLPDEAQRRRHHMRFFLVAVEHAVRRGEVQLHFDVGYAGAALWLEAAGRDDNHAGAPDMETFENALGPDGFERFLRLDDLMRRHHPPDVPHAYLTFIGVTPALQGRGIGRALLENKLDQLDEAGTPAYLEASSERACHLYRRLGFLALGDPFALPHGPQMHPMWREPKRQRQPENSRWPSWPS